jgi:hypothetical protein
MRAPWDFFKGGREETEMPKSQVIPTVAEPKKGVEFIAVSYRRLVSRPGYENEAIEVTATVRPGETLDDVLLGCQAEVNARLGYRESARRVRSGRSASFSSSSGRSSVTWTNSTAAEKRRSRY